MNEAQKTLYYIAENMHMQKTISEEGYQHFQRAIELLGLIPDNATNGDVIKAMFPDWQFLQLGYFVSYMLDAISFNGSLHWWNMPYKKEGDRG